MTNITQMACFQYHLRLSRWVQPGADPSRVRECMGSAYDICHPLCCPSTSSPCRESFLERTGALGSCTGRLGPRPWLAGRPRAPSSVPPTPAPPEATEGPPGCDGRRALSGAFPNGCPHAWPAPARRVPAAPAALPPTPLPRGAAPADGPSEGSPPGPLAVRAAPVVREERLPVARSHSA